MGGMFNNCLFLCLFILYKSCQKPKRNQQHFHRSCPAQCSFMFRVWSFFWILWCRQCKFLRKVCCFGKMQMEWYNMWLDSLDNFGRLYEGRDTAEIIEAKALQVYTHQISLHSPHKRKQVQLQFFSPHLFLKLCNFFVYVQLLKGKDQDLKLHLEKVLKSGDFSGFQAECLTDTWIGKDRFNFSCFIQC